MPEVKARRLGKISLKSKLEFRYDIQALRAVAVVLVMIFHAQPEWMPGGFLGVDMFFTISGFVIFRLLQHDLSERTFEFKEFYKRRIVRLFPALFVTVALTLFLSLIFLPSELIDNFLSSAAWALAASSNIFFYLDTSYFSNDAIEKPLLHLWSLGVEEQFYLVFPMLVVSVFALKAKFQVGIISFILILSALASQYFVVEDPSAAFFLTPMRAFQFLIGALVCFLPVLKSPRKYKGIIWWSVLVMVVVVCLFGVDENTRLPGYTALLFSTLVASLIYVGGGWSNEDPLISSSIFQSVGNASYSLYLAHWPVVVFVQHELADYSQSYLTWVELVFGFLLGGLLYLFIEKPMRAKRLKQVLPTLLGVYGLVVASLLLNIPSDSSGKDERNATGDDSFYSLFDDRNSEKTKLINAMLMGDSHAGSLSAYFIDATSDQFHVDTQISQGCPPLLGVYKIYTQKWGVGQASICSSLQEKKIASINKLKPQLVVIAARWELYHTDDIEGYPQPWQDWLTVEEPNNTMLSKEKNLELIEYGIVTLLEFLKDSQVILFGQVPLQTKNSYRCARKMLEKNSISNDYAINSNCSAATSQLAKANYKSLSKLFSNIENRYDNLHYVDPVRSLCDENVCKLVEDNKLLYKDDNHLSYDGSHLLLKEFLRSR